ncbi:anhydro-N-acetylmuramic acid kinase [Aggregatilineales bacterium SYSU G02658]
MKVVGLMSGTSADGIDAALCEISGAPPTLSARVLHGRTFPYDAALRQRILEACQPETSSSAALCALNVELGAAFAQAVLDLLREAELDVSAVDLIASHGQTVWHEVRAGRVYGTLQLGEACVIAEQTGVTTIHNFRARDVAAGGHGAPLTAYVDWLLLRHPTRWRAVQNIGGMGNVSCLPPLSEPSAPLSAFDTGPGNALIDAATDALTEGQHRYDPDGQFAAQGRVDAGWLTALMQHPYLHQPPPKTTGRELFGTAQARALVAEGRSRGLGWRDILATLTAFTAHSIAHAYRAHLPHAVDEIVLSGGGQHNRTLVNMLAQAADAPVLTHEALGLSGDLKEALVFAVLAYETWHGRPATLPSQTGARHPSLLGQITPSANYEALLAQRGRA